MKKVKLILLPEGKEILALPGRKVKEILEEEKKSISFPCGGRGICGKCKIRIKGEFSPLTEEEREILSPEERKGGIRLACQVKVKGEG
ncbi:MAG TPA: 2Fe-2S iron-sulfur cluster binding domain-containing protein, partial [bacterium]|nr:2Fe-2S iron-sulfur cluster binding domain-containing protein [bacterium]HEX68481.1 2Fe-2S iron-sulfur cluster binding domain-containing protein [bacterium]